MSDQFRTYEEICLEKLKELGTATAKDWCDALGYKHPSNIFKIVRRIKKNHPDKLKIYKNQNPRRYEAL
jgi:prophage antirepressor-like protein